MNIIKAVPDGIFIIEPDVFVDNRGSFYESYSFAKLKSHGISTVFVQENHAISGSKGTLRGLHFQKEPYAQTKLVRCTRGAVLDVAADIRKGSPTYCRWLAIILSEENRKQLYIPPGFAHGYLTLTDDTELQYKVDNYYSPKHERSVRYNDPALGIDWGTISPILSDRDSSAPLLNEIDNGFIWQE